MRKIKRVIANCGLKITDLRLLRACCGLRIAERELRIADSKKLTPNNYSLVPNKPVPQNTLTTFPQYLKKPVRFWTCNVGDEIRSSFNLELYEKVCEAKGLESGVEIIS